MSTGYDEFFEYDFLIRKKIQKMMVKKKKNKKIKAHNNQELFFHLIRLSSDSKTYNRVVENPGIFSVTSRAYSEIQALGL